MKSFRFPLILCLLAPAAMSQDGAAPPNPNDPAYAPLKAFLGSWNCSVKMGGETMAATETYEPLCGGVFFRSIVRSTMNGEPFHGLSIWGYDPQAQNYVNVWVDSMGYEAVWATATYDAASKTWTANGKSQAGTMRSILKWTGPDAFEETSYNVDGEKQVEFMHIERTRAKAGATDAASTTVSEKVQSEKAHAEKTATAVAQRVAPSTAGSTDLLKSVGKWDVVMKVMGPDGSAMEFKGKESGSAACNGKWVWSDFRSDSFMGNPFSGAGLMGYDPTTKTYTQIWVDSMGPYMMKLTGTLDPKTKVLTMKGASKDPMGNDMPTQICTSWTGDDAFVSKFEFGTGEQTMKMELRYTRAHEVPDHAIPATKIK